MVYILYVISRRKVVIDVHFFIDPKMIILHINQCIHSKSSTKFIRKDINEQLIIIYGLRINLLEEF